MEYAELAGFLVNGALYRVEALIDPPIRSYPSGTSYIEAPTLVDRQCPTCGPTKWKLMSSGAYDRNLNQGAFEHLGYKCRNCDETELHVWVLWWGKGGSVNFTKFGQFPKPEVTIPKEFEKALGDKRSLYIKGMTARHNNYGIGALTYFRRVIEDTTDEMLDLLEKAMQATNADPAALAKLLAAKTGTRFEDKVKIAGEVMPAHLRPGGVNPFADLYDLLSAGLHEHSDEECCDIVDAMDQSLKFVYTQLKTHVEDAKAYEAAAQNINATVARIKARTPEK